MRKINVLPRSRCLAVCDRQSSASVEAWASVWHVERRAAAIALDLEMETRAHGGSLTMANLGELARRIDLFGDDRYGEGVGALRRQGCYCQQDIEPEGGDLWQTRRSEEERE